MIYYLSLFFILVFVHLISRKIFSFNELATWYLIHSIDNFYVIYISINPILSIIRDPLLELFNPQIYYDTTIVVDILHLYHMLCFTPLKI